MDVDAGADAAVTRAVTDRHIASFIARDIEAFMADYADGAWIKHPWTTLRGKDAIRAAVETMFTEWAKPTSTAIVDFVESEEDVGFFVWHGETADTVIHTAAYTSVLRDGKIARQTGVGTTTSKVT